MEDVDDIAIPGFSGVELRVEDFPANLPEPRIKRPPTPDITIHQYSCSSEHSYGSNPLEHGRRVVGMATIASGWRSVIPPVFGLFFRDDRLFSYALPPPVLSSETLLTREKEWGEPTSSDEIFSFSDLDEFVCTDFSYLCYFAPSNRQLEIDTTSQYDPYAQVPLFGMDSMPHVPLTFSDVAPCGAEGVVSPDLSTIPGFTLGASTVNCDAELNEKIHPEPTSGPRFERDHPSSTSDADIYGSSPHNLSPPGNSGHSNSSQADDYRDRRLIRRFDTSTLLYLVPEPHFYPGPSTDLSIARRSLIPPFTRCVPIPIYPSTDTSVEIYLQTSHSRGSWIIPVRGVLPWDGCTKARVLQPIPAPDAYPPKPSFEGYTDLFWTHASLVAFWGFLREFNEAGRMGSVGISFHADTSFNDGGPASDGFEPTPQDDFLFDLEPSDPRVSLLLVDHIKIYCDAEFAMKVRTVLASWQYTWDAENAAEDAFDFDLSGSQASEIGLYGRGAQKPKPRKIQLLDGARIPFLDHRNNGLFVC